MPNGVTRASKNLMKPLITIVFWRIFEMPVLGYLGYLPFALELFGLYHLVTGFFPGMGKSDYLQFIPVHKDSP